MKFNRKKFFDGVKDRIDPTLSQEQVDGLTFLLGQIESDPFWKFIPQISYMLATVYHETAGSFQPVEEGYYLGKGAKAFQKKLRYYPYFGRGYVQITWKKNYEKAEKLLGGDFTNHPEIALQPLNAYKILTYGMHQGWFTGKKLDDFIKGKEKDYVNARKIVNGLDRAGLIAGYASNFEQILKDSATTAATHTSDELDKNSENTLKDGTATQPSPKADPTIEQNVAVVKEEPLGFWATLKVKIGAAFTGIGGATGLTTYGQQAQAFGLSSLFWERIFYIALIAFIGWIVIEVIRWGFTKWYKRKRTDALVLANSTPTNSVNVIRPEEIAKYQAQGWVVIQRA